MRKDKSAYPECLLTEKIRVSAVGPEPLSYETPFLVCLGILNLRTRPLDILISRAIMLKSLIRILLIVCREFHYESKNAKYGENVIGSDESPRRRVRMDLRYGVVSWDAQQEQENILRYGCL